MEQPYDVTHCWNRFRKWYPVELLYTLCIHVVVNRPADSTADGVPHRAVTGSICAMIITLTHPTGMALT